MKVYNVDDLTIGIGFAFTFYGVCLYSGDIKGDNAFITGLSLAGLVLVINDFLDFYRERGVLKIGKFQVTDDGYFIFTLKFILYAIVGLSIIGIPDFLGMKFSAEELSRLNDSSSTFALGATILLAGFKNKLAAIDSVNIVLKDRDKTRRELVATTEELQEALENHNNALEAHKETLFELAEIKRELEYLKNNQEVAATTEGIPNETQK